MLSAVLGSVAVAALAALALDGAGAVVLVTVVLVVVVVLGVAVAGFRTGSVADQSAVSWPEGMGRESLLALDFVERREDLVLMGDVGTGKTHMASALCALACERRLEARFFTASSLVMRLRRARDDGRLDREAALIGKARLLVIDELGFLPLDADGARLLFQIFADAYERQSVVITTNLEFSRWGSVFGDDQMAAAVIDRIVHHGRLVQFRGESYRVRHALMQEG